jgi:hypothetical protein
MTETQEVSAREPLTLNDRCDSCSAAAKVVFTLLNGELMFCGHHAKDKQTALTAKSISVWDPESVLI